ncbi:hypothetical protein NZD85_10910 [Empedobacter stercoris]|uniref:DUF4402 domain-containing protein n=1 Tax=Empedobacter falsenii TaxID=343874 RepID=A0ABY8V8G2_9FLAO|nr:MULTISPECIES: hypothetical protein [Empedobacter]UWX66388.1 hypothetical protein NZD85_10910 [Empedobacter stercoris]WIH96579.1 hypothetical protein OBA43_09925 [Empedobacter falsenii]
MKKLAFFLTIFCGLVSGTAFAQEAVGPKTASATLNVKLYPIQTILIGGDNIVNLEYQTKEDYSNGVTSNMNDHLIVYSTGGFAVKVKSDNENLEYTSKDGKDHKIAVSTINLQASLGTGNELTKAKFPEVKNLTNSDKNLISSAVGGTDLKFNVAYKGRGNNAYLNKYYNVENPNVYTTTVTYTIEAQ